MLGAMSLRMPQTLSAFARPDSGMEALTSELQSERAQALGRSGKAVEAALSALAAAKPVDPGRPALVKAAAAAVWRYFVQREACGLINHDQPVSDYRIPAEVLSRVGSSV
jgi:Family of unknown function (DUF6665)